MTLFRNSLASTNTTDNQNLPAAVNVTEDKENGGTTTSQVDIDGHRDCGVGDRRNSNKRNILQKRERQSDYALSNGSNVFSATPTPTFTAIVFTAVTATDSNTTTVSTTQLKQT